MVKKLLKQEMIYYIRSILPVYVILIGIAVMGRVIHIFESDHWIYSMVANSSLAAYMISIFAVLLFTTIFIRRSFQINFGRSYKERERKINVHPAGKRRSMIFCSPASWFAEIATSSWWEKAARVRQVRSITITLAYPAEENAPNAPSRNR